jgi:hypothetical protein
MRHASRGVRFGSETGRDVGFSQGFLPAAEVGSPDRQPHVRDRAGPIFPAAFPRFSREDSNRDGTKFAALFATPFASLFASRFVALATNMPASPRWPPPVGLLQRLAAGRIMRSSHCIAAQRCRE